MEKFELLKKYLQIFGIARHRQNGWKYFADIALNCIFVALHFIYFLSVFWFCAFEAQTFNEISESFFYVLSSLLSTAWYVVYVWQSPKYTKLFADLDEIIEKSKKNHLRKYCFPCLY